MAKSHGDWLSVPFEDTATRDALKAKYGCFAGAEAAGFPGVARSEEEPRWDEMGRDRTRSDEIGRDRPTSNPESRLISAHLGDLFSVLAGGMNSITRDSPFLSLPLPWVNLGEFSANSRRRG